MHFQHAEGRLTFRHGTLGKATSMRTAASHTRGGVRISLALLGWALTTLIVLAAVFGPTLIVHRLPPLIELRHQVLMIDREFERWALGTRTSCSQTEASRDV